MREKRYCQYCRSPLVKKFFEGAIRPFCEICFEPVYENPIPATAVVVADHQGKVLLVKRTVDPKKGFWCLPGGFLELGETPEQGALRELKEETGLQGKINSLLGVSTSNSQRYHTVLLIGFFVNDYSGKLIPGDDASDAAYFDRDELPEIAFESHVNFIKIYYDRCRNRLRTP